MLPFQAHEGVGFRIPGFRGIAGSLMAASRVQCLRRILVEPRFGARLLSTGLADASSPARVEGGNGGVKVVGKELAVMRREYEKQISELRKKFAAEEERKKKEQRQVELVMRERIAVEKEKRLALKKEKSQIRALEVVEETKALRARLVSGFPNSILRPVGAGAMDCVMLVLHTCRVHGLCGALTSVRVSIIYVFVYVLSMFSVSVSGLSLRLI